MNQVKRGLRPRSPRPSGPQDPERPQHSTYSHEGTEVVTGKFDSRSVCRGADRRLLHHTQLWCRLPTNTRWNWSQGLTTC